MIGNVASSLGQGLFAGAIGTGVMTAVQMIEMKLSGREASDAPAEAAEKVFAIEPRDEKAEERLGNLVHFAYGTAWGGVRGLLGVSLASRAAGPVHFGLVWGTALAMLPALGLSPPATRWPKKEVAKDFALHAVYVAATSLAFEWIRRRTEPE